jgi:hypothetical protein
MNFTKFTYDEYKAILLDMGFVIYKSGVTYDHLCIPKTDFGIVIYGKNCLDSTYDGMRYFISERYFIIINRGNIMQESIDMNEWFEILPQEWQDKIIFNLDIFK